MRKYGVALAALALIAGCSETQSKDERFISQLHARHVIPKRITAEQRAFLIDRGHRWCKAISAPGVTEQMVKQAIAEQTATWTPIVRARRAVDLGTAVQVYCPEVGKRLAGD